MKLKQSCLAATIFTTLLIGWQLPALAASCGDNSTCVYSGNGENSLTKEEAREQKEQWDDTRSLRKKVNKRAEKEFDKYDKQDDCNASSNPNAYWEPNTMRCLDRNTGRPTQ